MVKSPLPFLLLALLVLLAVAPAGLAASEDHNSGAKQSKKEGDGYYKPVAQNKNWKLFDFTVTMEQTVTSFRPAPPPNDNPPSPNTPGSIASITSRIFNEDGDVIGIGSWNRLVVSNVPVNPDAPDGDSIATRLLSALFEFGDPDEAYGTPDSLSVTITTKWLLSATQPSEFTDFDGVISGGIGRWVGAGGRVSVSDVVIVNNLLQEAKFRFRFYVPADLPHAY